MAFLKINGNDYSKYINILSIGIEHVYTGGTLSNGKDWAVYKRTKHTFTVGIIPLESSVMAQLEADISGFYATVSYRDPQTDALVEDIDCIIPVHDVEYYTIRADKVSYKAVTLIIKEL